MTCSVYDEMGFSMNRDSRWIGYVYVLLGASFWGVGGTVAQHLFHNENMSVEWLVSFRLIVSGLMLLTIAGLRKKKMNVIRIWSNRQDAIKLIVLSLLGMLAVQYTYMISIQLGNAAVATLLQYLAPIFIMIYLIVNKVTLLQRKEIIAILLALTGTFLLLTNGSVHHLSVPISAIIWGILSGIALAFYTLYPKRLLDKWGSLTVVGWAMLIGGSCLALFYPPWEVDMTDWTISTVGYLIFVVIFGTMFAFWFYLESLTYLKPQETSLLGTVEPLTAIITSVLWLQIPFGIFQLIGSGLILTNIIFLTIFPDNKPLMKDVLKKNVTGKM